MEFIISSPYDVDYGLSDIGTSGPPWLANIGIVKDPCKICINKPLVNLKQEIKALCSFSIIYRCKNSHVHKFYNL